MMSPHVISDGEVENKEQDYSLLHATELLTSSWLVTALDTVVQLGVLDVLARAGAEGKLSSAEEIAAQLHVANPDAPVMLDRTLRLLASHGVVACSLSGDNARRLYALNSVSKYFIPNPDGVSLKAVMALCLENALSAAMRELKNAILEGGIPFSRANGMPVFEYCSKDGKFNQAFNEAMLHFSTLVMDKILESYHGFKDFNCLVDVGGGLGITLATITSKYPSIRGINFDLPHVIHNAPTYPGVEHIGGDMFKSVPNGDAIILKMILHNWDDNNCIKLLKNSYNAIPDNGKVIVMEHIFRVLPDTSESTRGSLMFDFIMSIQFAGGKERTLEEYRFLATKAGFSDKIECHDCANCNFRVMEFVK